MSGDEAHARKVCLGRIKDPSTFGDTDPWIACYRNYLQVSVTNVLPNHSPLPKTTTARLRLAAALRAAQTRCRRPCRRKRSRFRLRRVTRRSCQARCPTVGCPSPRARAWIMRRRALGQNQDGSG